MMNDLAPFLNEFGLLNPTLEDINSENSPLVTWQYLLFNDNFELRLALFNYIVSCESNFIGLFNQSPTRHNNHDDYMSPDQLIAFICFFDDCVGTKEVVNDIAWYLLTHLLTYDNLIGKINFKRTMQPMAVVAVFMATNRLSHYLLYPLMTLICMISIISDKGKASGKLKAWTIMQSFDMEYAIYICTKLLRFGGFVNWIQVFQEYYKNPQHPLRQKAESFYQY